jgi:hypothetical protein
MTSNQPVYRHLQIHNNHLEKFSKTTETSNSTAQHAFIFTQKVYEGTRDTWDSWNIITEAWNNSLLLFHKFVLHATYNTFITYNNSNYSSKCLVQTSTRTVPTLVFYLESIVLEIGANVPAVLCRLYKSFHLLRRLFYPRVCILNKARYEDFICMAVSHSWEVYVLPHALSKCFGLQLKQPLKEVTAYWRKWFKKIVFITRNIKL